MSDQKFGDEIAKLIFKSYSSLPRKGKPNEKEWTILAGLVMEMQNLDKLENDQNKSSPSKFSVVALGTGNKCLNRLQLRKEGDVVNDSHAEIMMKRSFQRFLFSQIQMIIDNQNNNNNNHNVIFEFNENTKENINKPILQLKKGIKFHMYVSQTPCGDAQIDASKLNPSIQTTSTNQKEQEKNDLKISEDKNEVESKTIKKKEEKKDESNSEPPTKKRKKNPSELPPIDLQTGADPVPGEFSDPKIIGNFHNVEVLRFKPGGGETTLSLSCSDKICSWNYLGIQGCLLSTIIEPIYLHSLTVGDLFNFNSLDRALNGRLRNIKLNSNDSQKLNQLTIHPTSLQFELSKLKIEQTHGAKVQEGNARASPTSIGWNCLNMHDVLTGITGMKIGVTAKQLTNPKSRSLLCPLEMFQSFKLIYSKILKLESTEKQTITFWDFKTNKSQDFEQSKLNLISTIPFKHWPRRNKEFYQFT